MHKKINRAGFTLLELVIVIIIVGVLASLALPRFLKVIEQSRGAEALINISALRQAMERCYLMNNGIYKDCTMTKLGIDNPGQSPNAHFSYVLVTASATMIFQNSYQIWAVRNTVDSLGSFMSSGGGLPPACPADGTYCPPANTGYIRLQQLNGAITITGAGAFARVQ